MSNFNGNIYSNCFAKMDFYNLGEEMKKKGLGEMEHPSGTKELAVSVKKNHSPIFEEA